MDALSNVDPDLLDLFRELVIGVRWFGSALAVALVLRIAGVNLGDVISSLRGRSKE